MRLRSVFTGLAVLTVILMVGWPIFVGVPPKGATRQQLARYAVRAQIYVPVLLLTLFATGVVAILVFRAAREEYRQESTKLVAELIEGTLRDHRRKAEGEDEPAG